MENNILFKTKYKNNQKSNKWMVTLIILAIALAIRIILVFAPKYPNLVENIYSTTIYPYITRALGLLSRIIPFSIAEFLLGVISLALIGGLVAIILKPRIVLNKSVSILHFLLRLFALIYILFYFLWGFNYYRQDYSTIANMVQSPTRYDELKELTGVIIDKSNEIRRSLPEDDRGLLLIEESFKELGKIANKGFDDYKVGNLTLGGNYGPIKSVFLSKYMSYTGITGIYIPFTSEPTINIDIPNQNLLSTISHEIAHQRGFAREDEANFIAYKANINNPDKRFQYSGYYLAMSYLMNEIYMENEDDYRVFYGQVSEPVKRDIEFTKEYWQGKESRVNESVNKINDRYLKANNQGDGVRTYNQVVNLLLSDYKGQK